MDATLTIGQIIALQKQLLIAYKDLEGPAALWAHVVIEGTRETVEYVRFRSWHVRIVHKIETKPRAKVLHPVEFLGFKGAFFCHQGKGPPAPDGCKVPFRILDPHGFKGSYTSYT